jgi:hypothetical protein
MEDFDCDAPIPLLDQMLADHDAARRAGLQGEPAADHEEDENYEQAADPDHSRAAARPGLSRLAGLPALGLLAVAAITRALHGTG